MKKFGRRYMEEFINPTKSIVVSAWFDNKQVLTLSNYIGEEPSSECNRFDRKQQKRIQFKQPRSVSVYNKFMGGVDKADMLLSFYRTKFRSQNWYYRIAFHLFSLASTNACIVYKKIGDTVFLVNFLHKIC